MSAKRLQALSRHYLQCLAERQWEQALGVCHQALAIVPCHPQIVGDMAMCLMRLGDTRGAEAAYEMALEGAPNDANLHDGMAELCGLTAQADKARHHGMQALALKDAMCCAPVAWPLPAGRGDAGIHDKKTAGGAAPVARGNPVIAGRARQHVAPPPLSPSRDRNVIAFSLFGDQPRYCETAVLNVQAAHLLFPQWTCRFYLDGSVPEHVLVRLEAAGARLIHATGAQWQGVPPLMWRFAVMDDPTVDRFLLRDADSLLSTREQATVQAWLQSDLWFHMMRDYYTHTELLLAGLLGGCGGVFPGIAEAMRAYAREHAHEQRVVDQHFLRHKVWPTVRQSLLTHDSWIGFMNAQPFPLHSDTGLGEHFHVGCNLASASIGADGLGLPEGAIVRWQILDAQGIQVCHYSASVRGGAWRVALPQPYIQRIRAGEWKVV